MAFVPILLLTFLSSLSLANPVVRAPGQNGETCISADECVGERICLSTETSLPCNQDDFDLCVCVPPSAASVCTSTEDCDEGELCVLGAALEPLLSSTCISDRLVIPELNLIEYDDTLVLSGGPLAPCRTDSQCGGEGSRCLTPPFDFELECSPLLANCACVPDGGLATCTGGAECGEGEVCAELVDPELLSGPVCAVESVLRVSGFQVVDAEESVSDETPSVDVGEIVPGGDVVSVPTTSLGLTFDTCLSDEDCVSQRVCIGPIGPCEGNVGDKCACVPSRTSLHFCGNDEDCIENEACAQGSPAKGLNITGNCVSSAFLASEENVEPYDGPGLGVSLESCVTTGGCAEGRECDTSSGANCALFQCICVPPSEQTCRLSSECLEREVCAKVSDEGLGPVCVSEEFSGSGFVELVDDRQTLEACTNDGECGNIRRCNTVDFNAPCSPTTPNCVCKPRDGELRDCSIGVGCPGREVCAIGGVDSVTGGVPKCVDKSALERFGLELLGEMSEPIITPSPEEDEEGEDGDVLPFPVDPIPVTPEPFPEETSEIDTDLVLPTPEVSPEAAATPGPSPSPVPFICVDAELLGEFSMKELVFEEHAHGSVLCDKNGSCATDGHMVTWNGYGMMMRSYCDMIESGCDRRIMKVNSPRYKKGLRVSSRTEGLEFTAFAAKYATRVEEFGLNALVRVGM